MEMLTPKNISTNVQQTGIEKYDSLQARINMLFHFFFERHQPISFSLAAANKKLVDVSKKAKQYCISILESLSFVLLI